MDILYHVSSADIRVHMYVCLLYIPHGYEVRYTHHGLYIWYILLYHTRNHSCPLRVTPQLTAETLVTRTWEAPGNSNPKATLQLFRVAENQTYQEKKRADNPSDYMIPKDRVDSDRVPSAHPCLTDSERTQMYLWPIYPQVGPASTSCHW